ncbi:MAG: hypothetical protein K2M34_01345 [Alphaproteobacteria bacterium]|nr:hypothetical protein [Alphaproteobacteria bacterium]
MKTWDAIKLYAILGLTFGMTAGCASSRHGTNNTAPRGTIYTDTMRVAHVRYTPERDYVNLELIENGHPTEQYTEITASQKSPTTFFGDTVLIHHKAKSDKIINISAQRRTHQR